MTNDATLGGYVCTYSCPPAFQGSDGLSYTVEIIVDDDPGENGLFGSAVLFVRWSRDNDKPDGHLETGYLANGVTQAEARASVEGLTLHKLKEHLDRLIEERKERPAW